MWIAALSITACRFPCPSSEQLERDREFDVLIPFMFRVDALDEKLVRVPLFPVCDGLNLFDMRLNIDVFVVTFFSNDRLGIESGVKIPFLVFARILDAENAG
ncbi:hypothetical protein SAMN05444422_1241 [Halobiforma haloterrestris]|uniref:Uncharacterized protein n=1 Tax=Natronobacterium haloterrestre TaxID=148448 RepID=A0A1I1M4M5_NATHA|nr:hypothetical protein SAMN05444422_1241 [Halobiforma haloterrestris]